MRRAHGIGIDPALAAAKEILGAQMARLVAQRLNRVKITLISPQLATSTVRVARDCVSFRAHTAPITTWLAARPD